MGSSVYVQGGTAHVELAVEADAPVLLRDRVPYTARVLTEHSDDVIAVAPRPHRGVTEVYLGGPAKRHDAECLVEMPDSSGSYEFGPTEVRTPDATDWAAVEGTADEVYVVGGEL
ncbi:MAG: hypothetical protein ACI8U4_000484 [Natronomonas sp.]|jgi:hypothetical protein